MQESKDRQQEKKKNTSIKTQPADTHRGNETRVETIKMGQRNKKGWREQKVGHETTPSHTNHEKKHLSNLGSKKRQKINSNRQESIQATHR